MKPVKEILDIFLSPSMEILRAIEIIDAGTLQVALVIDEQYRLLGIVTDGDVRRGILRGVSMSEPVRKIMNPNPTTIAADQRDRESILSRLKQKRIRHLPVVDEQGKVIGMEVLEDLIQCEHRDNWVILMVGGLGSRLRPLTENCPKPLLKIGNKPILEMILENFIAHKFRRFYFSVYYKNEMFEQYFGDGSRWGVEIRYIYEKQRMGTAGSLRLLPEKPANSVFVMNGDLLTKVNLQQLFEFHLSHRVLATACVSEFTVQVPYGVVSIEKGYITCVDEKPEQRFFVNAGIYVFEPEVFDLLPSDTFFDMPTLLNQLIRSGREIAVFPLRESWIDIGQIDELTQARQDPMRFQYDRRS